MRGIQSRHKKVDHAIPQSATMLIKHKSRNRTWSDKPISIAANVSQKGYEAKKTDFGRSLQSLEKEKKKTGAKKHKCAAASHLKRKKELTDVELEVEDRSFIRIYHI